MSGTYTPPAPGASVDLEFTGLYTPASPGDQVHLVFGDLDGSALYVPQPQSFFFMLGVE